MNIRTWGWLILSLTFECVGDIAIKKGHLFASLISYNIMLALWFAVVRSAGQKITVPGTVWLLGGELLLVVIGVGMFKESLTALQWLGLVFGLIAVVLMSSK